MARARDSRQLDLFSQDASDPALRLEAYFKSLRDVAQRLPARIHFGTSSWSFPGWKGLVYPSERSASELSRTGLVDYVRHPLFRCVGVDRSYYRPLSTTQFEELASQLPSRFPCLVKAPSYLTSPRLDDGPPSPSFFDFERFERDVLLPVQASFAEHCAALILQLSAGCSLDLPQQLEKFLSRAPKGLRLAVELRDAHLLTPAYSKVLRRYGATHVYNYWSQMPLPGQQARIVPIEPESLVVIRLMLRPGTQYEQRRVTYAPYDGLRDIDDAMRDEVTELLSICDKLRCTVYVLVNNKAEGSAPLTIEALARRVVDRVERG